MNSAVEYACVCHADKRLIAVRESASIAAWFGPEDFSRLAAVQVVAENAAVYDDGALAQNGLIVREDHAGGPCHRAIVYHCDHVGRDLLADLALHYRPGLDEVGFHCMPYRLVRKHSHKHGVEDDSILPAPDVACV